MNGRSSPLRPSPSLLLGLLLVAYVLNYLDRQILGILAGKIIADLKLTDTQFGLLSGPPFAVFYSLLGIPFAYLADRTSRSRVIAAAVAVWSAFTGLCGFAGSFLHLFLFRMGVGIGEAGGVAPSNALIADYFPAGRRARAMAIFYLGVPVGMALGTLIGAYLAAAISWRAAFWVMGGAGLLLAPVMLRFVRDVPRDRSGAASVRLGDLFSLLGRKPAFWLLALAASCSSLSGYGLAVWTPSVLERSFGMGLLERGQFFASLLLVGGCSGVLASGWLADRLGAADRRWHAWLPAIAWLITAPTYAAGLLSSNWVVAWLLLLIPNALNIMWLSPVITAVQHLVPRAGRATASAAFLLFNNLIGLGIGPLLMGRLSDALKASHGEDALRDAAVLCLGFYPLAAFLALLAARSLRECWVADDSTS